MSDDRPWEFQIVRDGMLLATADTFVRALGASGAMAKELRVNVLTVTILHPPDYPHVCTDGVTRLAREFLPAEQLTTHTPEEYR